MAQWRELRQAMMPQVILNNSACTSQAAQIRPSSAANSSTAIFISIAKSTANTQVIRRSIQGAGIVRIWQ
jgi:hypothetical protein